MFHCRELSPTVRGSNTRIHRERRVTDHILGVRVDGVPPACMNLATVIAGQPSQEGGPVPIPMGSDSLQYNDLSQDNLRELGYNLKAKNII